LRKLRVPFGAVAVLLIVPELASRHLTSWFLGLALGALVTIYAALRDTPPAHIEKWRTGAEGERRTAAALAALRRRGYVLLHDLPDRRPSDRDLRGNIDHVVVSTAGVFLLDSKWLGGEVSIDGDVIRVQMIDDDEDSYEMDRLASGMRGRAIRLQEDIVAQAEVPYVQAVVVFWNPFPAGVVEQNRVVYIEGARLAAWLGQQSPKIVQDRVPFIAHAIVGTRPAGRRTWCERIRAPWRVHGSRSRAALPT
jgi:Nuclease-related domain